MIQKEPDYYSKVELRIGFHGNGEQKYVEGNLLIFKLNIKNK